MDKEASIGDFGVSLGGQPSGIPPFGKIFFSQDKFNGAAVRILSPTPFDMVASGVVEITTSALNHTGTSFKTVFVHS